jgi:2,3-bisphosphoglycerate-independent phosphoglycerate mutase
MQDLVKINQHIAENKLASNKVLLNLIIKLKERRKACHLLGLLSDGGVHSHINHMIALAEIISSHHIEVFLHCFLDGRDTSPYSAEKYLKQIVEHFQNNKLVHVATICGRYYAMDRDHHWDRIEIAYNAIALAQGAKSNNFMQDIAKNYQNNISDEFMQPLVSATYAGITDGDALVMANLRSDRARQILYAFTPNFNEFNRTKTPNLSAAIGMVSYAVELNDFIPAMFAADDIINNLPQVLAKNHIAQLRIAETEKFAHVSFFFNGGREELYPYEERQLIQSPGVKTYDLAPQMSALELTDELIKAINSDKYGFILLNFANADMVGHTGDIKATIKAIEVIDQSLAKIVEVVKKKNLNMIITADHGNAEEMFDYQNQQAQTAHTTNKVPLILVSNNCAKLKLHDGRLCDIAPTVLELLNIDKPQEMTGVSLIKR